MKTKWVSFISLGLIAITPLGRAATNDLSSALQRGLFEEEANHNLDAAIQAYQSVINRYDNDRKLAATAVFRLGESYRKQGKTNEAAAQYERVLREFTDQPDLLNPSHQNLAALGRASTAAPVASQAAREEQKRLLEEEIKLAEKDLSDAQKQRQNGVVGEDAVRSAQRSVLQLKRQLAALQAKPVADILFDANVAEPATSTETEEVKRIQAMIKDSPDLINAKDLGSTPLHRAASAGQLTVAQFLIASGADVDAKNNSNETPLHLAALRGHKGLVELLLSKKASPNARDNNGRTPLHNAAAKGFKSVAAVLLAQGADVNAKDVSEATPLHVAVNNFYKSVAELFLSQGANPNANGSLAGYNGLRGGTPLHVAAIHGDKAMVELLLTDKANVAITNGYGETPLHLAALHPEIAKLLLDSGADVHARSTDPSRLGGTPLHYATLAQQEETVALLLRNKADPNARFDMQSGFLIKACTPLQLACLQEQPAIVETLLAFKADPNLQSEDGTSPIIRDLPNSWPMSEKRKHIISLLLENGADVNSRNERGGTPLIVASAGADRELVKILLKHKPDVNALDSNPGWSALHWLAYAAKAIGRPSLNEPAEALVVAGADVNLRAKDGKTPLNVILDVPTPLGGSSTRSNFIELLRQHGALEDLPRPEVIQVRRPTLNFSEVAATKSTNDWNQFTVLEILAMESGVLTKLPQGESQERLDQSVWSGSPAAYPDLEKVRIKRPGSDFKSWQEQTVDLTPVVGSGDCSKNVPVEWGDVIEVPEADHPLNEPWPGFTIDQWRNFEKCLSRTVEVVLKGRATKVTLAPEVTLSSPSPFGKSGIIFTTHVPFWIKPALRKSNVLLASSDLSRVKVTRTDSKTGKKREWILDCSDSKPAPDFWLRDGDVIEVPDKT